MSTPTNDNDAPNANLMPSENFSTNSNALNRVMVCSSSQPNETDQTDDAIESAGTGIQGILDDSAIQKCDTMRGSENAEYGYRYVPENPIASPKAPDVCVEDVHKTAVTGSEHYPYGKTKVHHEETRSGELGLSSLCEMHLNTETYFKGCKWAPDGLCLMSCSNDNVIRLINTPKEVLEQKWDVLDCNFSMTSCLDVSEAEIIYDYAWWPHMNSMHPNTCCFVSTSKDQPIHLWDAFNGKLRASYIAKNQVDEVSSAYCLGFSPDGMQLICGFSK